MSTRSPVVLRALVGTLLLALTGCAAEITCACSGADVAYQAEADLEGVASEGTCSSGYEVGNLNEAGESFEVRENEAVATCCAPDATDCTCSCSGS